MFRGYGKRIPPGNGLIINTSRRLKQHSSMGQSNTPTWVFFTFFKLHEWYQIALSITYAFKNGHIDIIFVRRCGYIENKQSKLTLFLYFPYAYIYKAEFFHRILYQAILEKMILVFGMKKDIRELNYKKFWVYSSLNLRQAFLIIWFHLFSV